MLITYSFNFVAFVARNCFIASTDNFCATSIISLLCVSDKTISSFSFTISTESSSDSSCDSSWDSSSDKLMNILAYFF